MKAPLHRAMTTRDYALAFLVVLIWGVNFVAAKVGIASLPPFLLTGMRFGIAGLLLLPFTGLSGLPARLPLVFGVAISLGVLHFGMVFFGVQKVQAADAAIILQLGVPFSALCGRIFFQERLGWRQWGGMGLAFAGVALLAGESGPGSGGLSLGNGGYILLLVEGAAAWALTNVLIKKSRPIDPIAMNGWMALVVAPILLGLSALTERGQVTAILNAPWVAWGALAFTTLGSSVLAYSLWYRLLARHSLSQLVPLTMAGPVIGMVSGALMLGESLTWEKWVGGALTLAGVGVIQLRRPVHSVAEDSPVPNDGV